MCYIDKCNVRFLLDPFQFCLHAFSKLQIECSERLVQEKDPRPVYQRSRNGNPLLLAAGHAGDLSVLKPFEVDHFDHLSYEFLDFLFRCLFDAQAESNVVIDVQMREESVSLEDRVDFPFE